MKVTFILKNLSEYFYKELDEAKDKYDFLSKEANSGLNITKKIGNGQFNQSVDLNMKIRAGITYQNYRLESRNGYKLVTFNF